MSKEMKVILFVFITMILNILAPILMIDMYKDYTAKSFIIGSPQDVVKIENLDIKDYVFQENLSNMNFVETENENEYVFTYYFGASDFDSSENNYLMFINDYMLSISSLEIKAITGTHVRYFKDINHEICNEVNFEIRFEFYTNYSYLLVKINTEDITYFNGFTENPGFILTLSKVNYNMIGNTYADIEVEVPENSYRVIFNYPGYENEEVILGNEWYALNASFAKNVVAGQEIGEIPTYIASGVTVLYWYYIDDNDEHIKITSGSIMPACDIFIVPSLMVYEG